jgi:hypothetical protein
MHTRTSAIGVVLALAAALLVGCAPPPPPGPLPDPIISCHTMGGPIAYEPPASNAGVDVTITSLPGFTIEGCTPNTSILVERATVSDVVAVLPGFTCGAKPYGQLLGSGTGRIVWEDGASTRFDVDVVATGSLNSWSLELEFAAGRWAGATAKVVMVPSSSVGNCVEVPVTSAVLANVTPFVVHPG